ncbi:hypothetical protein N0V84_004426 [Fusarium piperis]|uniref:Methyltransferase n=1 Tax=Fusarium piperis TaxID=1435070 RepID=A0A9W9BQ99_9HYPO|nr:hypothetical protein N0V84_004426 [Fusarium piperis]
MVPTNVQFEIEDFNQEWTFDASRFDFIHMRALVGGIRDWKHVFDEAFRCAVEDGIVESHEQSFMLKSDNGIIDTESALGKMGNLFKEAGEKTGYSFTVVDDGAQRKLMEEAGFVDVKEVVKRVPISREPKDPELEKVGQFTHTAWHRDAEGYLIYLATQVFEWTIEKVYVFAMEVREQLLQMDVYVEHKIVVGRKPGRGSN